MKISYAATIFLLSPLTSAWIMSCGRPISMEMRRRLASSVNHEDIPESTSFRAPFPVSMLAAAIVFFAVPGESLARDAIPVPPSQVFVMRGVRATTKFVQRTLDESKSFDTIVDADDENSYIVFNGNRKIKIPKRRYNDFEVAEAGLLAGGALEVLRVVVTYPLDTMKTRLQRKPTVLEVHGDLPEGMTADCLDPAQNDGIGRENCIAPTITAIVETERGRDAPVPPRDGLLNRWWGGLGVALLSSAPQGAVFWAVKDVVRRNLLAWLGITSGAGTLIGKYSLAGSLALASAPPSFVQNLGLDWRGLATVAAVGSGEAAYWLVRTPTELAKTTAQLNTGDRAERDRGPIKDGVPGLIGLAAKTYPILALTDLPVVTLRIWLFLAFRSHGLGSVLSLEQGMTSDLVLYTVASIIANGICNPLEVVRTRLLLQLSGDSNTEYAGILDALATIKREEGVGALFKGILLRLIWNGLLVGIVLGVQRSYYSGAQGFFLGEVDELESVVRSALSELAMFASGIDSWDLNYT